MATPGVSGRADLNGLFKEVYGNLVDVRPSSALLQKLVKFDSASLIGNAYHNPVILTYAQGFTYAAPNSNNYNLNQAITTTTSDAVIPGFNITVREIVDLESVYTSQNQKSAFIQATKLKVESMYESTVKRVELALLYGQSTGGLGIADSSTNLTSTTTRVLLTAGTFAAGIWGGMENALVQFWTVSSPAVVGTGSFTIESVDADTREIVVSGSAGDITALDTALGGAGQCSIHFTGTRTGVATWNEMAGFDRIITNTGALFGINAAQYTLWKGNVYDVGGTALSFAKMNAAIARAVSKGGLAEEVEMLVSPQTWANLNNNEAANRRYDSSYKSGVSEVGTETIRYHSQNGVVNVHSHLYVKPGEAYLIPKARAHRVGGTDITMGNNAVPGGENGPVFISQLQDQNGYQIRAYTNQSVFVDSPAKTVKLVNIVNS